MINDETYKNLLKELHKDKESSADILLEKKFLKEKEEEVEEAEVVDEQGEFRRSIPQQPSQPRSTDPYERHRNTISKVTSDITREKISQMNKQKYLDSINKNK